MEKKNLKKGVFITFEGPEGCGKSVHSRLLVEYLKSKGYQCVFTREPGGTGVGEKIRSLLLDRSTGAVSAVTELFLFEASRAQLVSDVILPALKKNIIVISDRFSDATLAYQGYGGGLPLDTIRRIDSIATAGLKPDLTILLDINIRLGLKRATSKNIDRMESKTLRYHQRVRKGYLTLAKAHASRFRVIRVRGGIDPIQKSLRAVVEQFLRARLVKA